MNDENVKIDRRNKRIIRAIIGIVAVLSIAVGIFAWYAEVQKNLAKKQYKMAVSNRLASEAEFVMPKDNAKAIRIAE
ncbi:MAG: hypothetical protein NT166_05280 [Candidatus Aminicenantes bacterium]|nr:hypothetical protein [Candidatus Aminicenantes bacterium]